MAGLPRRANFWGNASACSREDILQANSHGVETSESESDEGWSKMVHEDCVMKISHSQEVERPLTSPVSINS